MAVPVKNPVGRVAVLLDLDDHESLADGVKTTTWNEDALAGAGRSSVQRLFHLSGSEGLLEGFTGYPVFQSCVDRGALRCMEEVPAFGLGFAPQLSGTGYRRVDLHG